MDKIDTVVKICKATKGLTTNQFYEICNRYGLTNEQKQQAQALVNGLTRVPVKLEK